MQKVPHQDAAVFGVDIGKKLFHVVGLDRSGEVVQRAKFTRETLLAFFASAEKRLIGMEACPGSQWLARRLIAFGHEAKIIPARFVKPYVKSNNTKSRCRRLTTDSREPANLIHHDKRWRFVMPAPIALRSDFDGSALRRLARSSKDADQTRLNRAGFPGGSEL